MKKMLIALLLASSSVLAAPSIQVGFSPEGSSRELVLSIINSAQSEIQMMAYSFNAQDVADALVKAAQRKVIVRLVVDERGNKSKHSLATMDYVVSNGVHLHTDKHYRIQHDKVIIVDGKTVETGSFNFSKSAEVSNSENVIVIKDAPDVVATYQDHWDNRWNQGEDYNPSVLASFTAH